MNLEHHWKCSDRAEIDTEAAKLLVRMLSIHDSSGNVTCGYLENQRDVISAILEYDVAFAEDGDIELLYD